MVREGGGEKAKGSGGEGVKVGVWRRKRERWVSVRMKGG